MSRYTFRLAVRECLPHLNHALLREDHEFLENLINVRRYTSAQRRQKGEKYRCAIDLWEAVSCAARIRVETGNDPISELVPGFFRERQLVHHEYHVRLEKLQEFEIRLEERGIKFKDNARSTHAAYRSYYGFSGDYHGGFVIRKSLLIQQLVEKKKELFAALQEKLFLEVRKPVPVAQR